MRKNYYTVIIGSKVVLVSYKKEHVPKYHDWMKNKELQTLTGSEPLSIAEEYKSQQSWLNDKTKCTFIILDKNRYRHNKDEVVSMIGDTNYFFNDPNEPDVAEVNIMIADPDYRGRKMGWEAMLLMFHYGISELNVKRFEAKILESNEVSSKMFAKLGFVAKERSEAFKEITMVRAADRIFKSWIETQTNFLKIKNCDIRVIASLTAKRKAKEAKKAAKAKKEKEQKQNDANDKKEGDKAE